MCLPETGTVKVTNTEKIRLNKEVFTASVFGMLEFFFLITFTTNIAMHLSGPLAGNTAVSGDVYKRQVPSLSVISLPMEEMAEECLKMLADTLTGVQSGISSRELPVRMILRESVTVG